MSKKSKKLIERASHTWSNDSIRMILTPSNEAKMTYFYIQEIGYFKTVFPYYTERENLNSFLIIYTISGEGTLEYRGETYTLSKGQCCYIDCRDYHKYFTKSKDTWEFLWVHFNGTNALGYHKAFLNREFCILNFKDGFLIERLIWRMIAINKKKNITTEILTSNLLHNLVTELLLQNSMNGADTLLIPNYIKEITKEIDKNFKEPLNLDYFQSQFGRNKYHIAKEFKKYIGVTINEYIILNRISYAKELLKYSELPISEITFEVGMNNISHFINLFKEREHMTPLSFRKEWKE